MNRDVGRSFGDTLLLNIVNFTMTLKNELEEGGESLILEMKIWFLSTVFPK